MADDGTDTQARVDRYGVASGNVAEYAFWLDAGAGETMEMTAADCVLTLLIGDGDADKTARKAILDSSEDGEIYTRIGAAIGSRDGGRYWMCDVVFAVGFTNDDDIEEC